MTAFGVLLGPAMLRQGCSVGLASPMRTQKERSFRATAHLPTMSSGQTVSRTTGVVSQERRPELVG